MRLRDLAWILRRNLRKRREGEVSMHAKYTLLDYVPILSVSMRRELIYILRGEYSSRPELAMRLAC